LPSAGAIAPSFGLAARRSELDVADLEEYQQGLRVTIHRSKTDQGVPAPWSRLDNW
jgi:hypothetical protein